MSSYIGKKSRHLVVSSKYDETRVSFRDILLSPKMNNIRVSESQRALNMDSVESMINEYISYPHFLKFKNRITIGIYNDTWYLVDGQHRIEMAKKLYDTYQSNDELIFCWFICEDESDLKKLFISLNKDSKGNEYYINMEDKKQYMIDSVIKMLSDNYRSMFNSVEKETSRIYSLKRVRDMLIEIEYFDKFENSTECYKDIINKNKEFYDILGYEKDILYDELDGYYNDDRSRIKEGFIIPCKMCKFIEWLKTGDNIYVYHQRKKQKKPISQGIRNKIWIHEYGDGDIGKCPISRCEKVLRRTGKGGFQAGHIISEKNGGKTEFMNLRPLCSECNQQMGHHNWIDYDSVSAIK